MGTSWGSFSSGVLSLNCIDQKFCFCRYATFNNWCGKLSAFLSETPGCIGRWINNFHNVSSNKYFGWCQSCLTDWALVQAWEGSIFRMVNALFLEEIVVDNRHARWLWGELGRSECCSDLEYTAQFHEIFAGELTNMNTIFLLWCGWLLLNINLRGG